MDGSARGSSSLRVAIDGEVAVVEICEPPHNHLSLALMVDLVGEMAALSSDGCRCVMLCSAGRNFCAGANLQTFGLFADGAAAEFYALAAQLFEVEMPIVAAVQGSAVGAGLGLALAADIRVACPGSRFVANFARLGFHQGFGLSVTLPLAVGHGHALRMFYTGCRVEGTEAFDIGLCEALVDEEDLRSRAMSIAHEIAGSAPLAVRSIKQTMRGPVSKQVRNILVREQLEQARLQQTADWSEGVSAVAERRVASFVGR
ncbi:MAG: enoyl-CoA hydratase/isomerase family protein [Actinomycetota bacterium]